MVLSKTLGVDLFDSFGNKACVKLKVKLIKNMCLTCGMGVWEWDSGVGNGTDLIPLRCLSLERRSGLVVSWGLRQLLA